VAEESLQILLTGILGDVPCRTTRQQMLVRDPPAAVSTNLYFQHPPDVGRMLGGSRDELESILQPSGGSREYKFLKIRFLV